jgi:hypothetical protein
MKTAPAIIIAISTIFLAGCVLKGKPAAVTPAAPQPVAAPPPAPAPPPQPLSMPQTQVQLPPVQPVDLDALTTATPAEVTTETPPAGRGNTRTRPRPQQANPPATVETPPATPVTQPDERGPVREVLPAAENIKLKNSADANKRTIRAWLSSSRGRRISPNDPTVARIRLMLKASDDAETKNDMREASDWADRALVLLRELQSGR